MLGNSNTWNSAEFNWFNSTFWHSSLIPIRVLWWLLNSNSIFSELELLRLFLNWPQPWIAGREGGDLGSHGDQSGWTNVWQFLSDKNRRQGKFCSNIQRIKHICEGCKLRLCRMLLKQSSQKGQNWEVRWAWERRRTSTAPSQTCGDTHSNAQAGISIRRLNRLS